MAVFIIFLVIVLIVIVMYGNEILRGSFKVQVVKFLPLGIFKEDKNKDKDSKIDNREESIKERHINKEKDNLHNSILIENENDLKESQIEAQENEIKVKEIEHDEITVEINEKGEEKTCVESEESNILDLIDENNDNLLNQEEIVYWTPNGKTYHSKSTCRTLARSKIINSGTVNESGKDFKCENCK